MSKSDPIMGKHCCVHDHACTYPFSRLLALSLSKTTRCFPALLSLLSSALLRQLRPTNSGVLILIANSPRPRSASPVILRALLPSSVEPKRIRVVTLSVRAPVAGLEHRVTVNKVTLCAMRSVLDHALQAQLYAVALLLPLRPLHPPLPLRLLLPFAPTTLPCLNKTQVAPTTASQSASTPTVPTYRVLLAATSVLTASTHSPLLKTTAGRWMRDVLSVPHAV